MTPSQYIEVAEKVWGWKVIEDPLHDDVIHLSGPFENGDPGKFTTAFCKADFRSQVNSWQGFGRTVEAMDKRNNHIFLDYSQVKFICNDSMCMDPKHKRLATILDDELDQIEATIEATHLAALEAIKSELKQQS